MGGPGGLGQDFYYSANWQVLEEQSAGVMKAQYVWSPVYVDALVARDVSGGPRLYAQQDANWNVTAAVTTAGLVQERFVYDPYGKPSFYDLNWNPVSDSLNWVYLHQGGRYDSNSGLYNFRNRDLSPTLGRWLEEDPVEYAARDNNLYSYELNAPTDRTDAVGLFAADVGDIAYEGCCRIICKEARIRIKQGILPGGGGGGVFCKGGVKCVCLLGIPEINLQVGDCPAIDDCSRKHESTHFSRRSKISWSFLYDAKSARLRA